MREYGLKPSIEFLVHVLQWPSEVRVFAIFQRRTTRNVFEETYNDQKDRSRFNWNMLRSATLSFVVRFAQSLSLAVSGRIVALWVRLFDHGHTKHDISQPRTKFLWHIFFFVLLSPATAPHFVFTHRQRHYIYIPSCYSKLRLYFIFDFSLWSSRRVNTRPA